MPMSQSFQDRLFPIADDIAKHYGTPFHIYDEAGIRETGRTAQAGLRRHRRFPRILCRQGAAKPAYPGE